MRVRNAFIRLTTKASIALILSACGILEPEGWQSTRWGMTERDVNRVLYKLLPTTCHVIENKIPLDADAKICINNYPLESRLHLVSFHFDPVTSGLYKVQLSSPLASIEFSTLVMSGLLQKYGAAENCIGNDKEEGDLQHGRRTSCLRWVSQRNIIVYQQFQRKGDDTELENRFVVTYQRGPVVLIDRL